RPSLLGLIKLSLEGRPLCGRHLRGQASFVLLEEIVATGNAGLGADAGGQRGEHERGAGDDCGTTHRNSPYDGGTNNPPYECCPTMDALVALFQHGVARVPHGSEHVALLAPRHCTRSPIWTPSGVRTRRGRPLARIEGEAGTAPPSAAAVATAEPLHLLYFASRSLADERCQSGSNNIDCPGPTSVQGQNAKSSDRVERVRFVPQ